MGRPGINEASVCRSGRPHRMDLVLQQVRADVVKIVEERDGTLARKVDMVDNKLDRVILYLCIKEKIRDGRICN
jgi:hypothetical protein